MRIFISHGTDKSQDGALEFLDTLDARLGAADAAGNSHDVLLDRTRIEAGDNWANILHDVLAECQAAVLLLSKRSLDRPWVLKEATILSFRKARDPLFPFFCVLLPGVSMDDVKARPGFSALRLDAIQAFAPGASAQQVAAWLLQKLSQVQPAASSPLDDLQRAIEAQITRADADELETLCVDLLGEPVAWITSLDRAKLRARVLARAIVRGRLGRVASLAAMAKGLKRAALPNEHRKEVVNLAASMWVDAEIAGQLGAVAYAVQTPLASAPIAVALNSARIRYGARMVAWRAMLPDTSDFIYWVEGGGSDGWEEELVARIRTAFRKANQDLIENDDEVDDVLNSRDEPVVFVLPPPVPDEALLQALRKLYPRVVFIVHTGSELPPAGTLPDCVVALSPGLRPDLEKAGFADYVTARETSR